MYIQICMCICIYNIYIYIHSFYFSVIRRKGVSLLGLMAASLIATEPTRRARDGSLHTKAEFLAHYGFAGEAKWKEAKVETSGALELQRCGFGARLVLLPRGCVVLYILLT